MTNDLAEEILKGNYRAAARLMRLLDDGSSLAREAMATLFPHTGGAFILGITGNPGSGKSSLVNELIRRLRRKDLRVGCVAVDPTSPFSGGAILGDRVRMQEHSGDPGVFIRSVATRGHLGGLSRSTPGLVQVMDAMGFDVIIIETVGVGQDEIDIVRFADTSLVVLVPGLGDDIQAEKAGLMEIADIFVLNKSDRPGIDRLHREVRSMLSIHRSAGSTREFHPEIIKTSVTRGEGLDELMIAIEAHQLHLESLPDQLSRKRDRQNHLVRAIARTELEFLFSKGTEAPEFQELISQVHQGTLDPYKAAHLFINSLRDTSNQ